MNKTMDWFVAADLREYADKYIAIVGQRVISSGDEPEKVYNEAKAKYPKEEVILWKVPRKDLLIFKTVNMSLGEYIFKVRIAWSQLEEVPLLLGRLDVFDRFDVTL